MLKKYKHIIWDWNGTILNDINLCVELINNLLEPRKLPLLTIDRYKQIFTIPVKDYYAKTGIDFSKDPFEIIGKEWMDQYESRKYECPLFDGIHDTFKQINELGISQSVLSGYLQITLEEMLSHYDLSKYLSHIIGLDNIYAASKIDIGIKMMNKLNLKRGEAVIIGDTLHDFEVSQKIGADCILLASGHQSREILSKSSAPIINDIRELLN